MGLAFWGGFASGMSQTIEKNRDRKLKADQLLETQRKLANDSVAKDKEDLFNTKIKTEKTLYDLQKEKQDVYSDAWKGTEEERVGRVNEINGRMFDAAKTANDYSAGLGKGMLVDLEALDTTELNTVTAEDGETYILPQDLAVTLAESDGKMKLVGNEIHQAVYEENSQGQPVEKKDANGNLVYEPSGTSLRKYGDVFKPTAGQDSATSAGQLNRLIDLQKKEARGEELTSDEKVEMTTLKQAKTPVTAQKNDLIDKGAPTIGHYLDNPEDIVNMKPSELNKIRAEERKTGLKGLGETEKKYYTDTESTLYSGKMLMDTLDKIGNEEVGRGVIDNIETQFKTMISDKSWENMGEAEKRKQLITIGLNTSIGSALAQYVKSISGTAVAEAEFQRLLNIFTGGDMSNIQTLKKSVGTFYEDLSNTYGQKINDNLMDGGSFLFQKAKTNYDRFGSPKSISTPEASKVQADTQSKYTFDSIRSLQPSWSDAKIKDFLKSKGL
jgi:hypothetical protein